MVQGGVTKVGRNQNLRALFLYGVKWCRVLHTLASFGPIWCITIILKCRRRVCIAH